MSKVKAPLFSFEARGKLADALVYFPWKGVDAVRTHVIPANPQTVAQTTQRTRMSDAVDQWHAGPYTAADIAAWNRLANLAASARSGFNRMVEEYILEDIDGNTWEAMSNLRLSEPGPGVLRATVTKASGGNPPRFWYGTSPTNMPNLIAMGDDGGNEWHADFGAAVVGTLYYCYFTVGTRGANWGRLGIYTNRQSQ